MDLFVYEFEANSPTSFTGTLSLPVLEVKTCQRTFFLSWTPLPATGTRRTFEGPNAYEFLLRFACGLESEIKGETDVFGQLKSAIRSFTDSRTDLDSDQTSLFSRLFEDTKEIRSQYLQGIGGNTYGALARRLLNPGTDSGVLILGAGQISKSVAPYFADSRLTVFNRSAERLAELKAALDQKGHPGITYSSASGDLNPLITSSDFVVIATPVGTLDSGLIAALEPVPPSERPVLLHLGGQERELDAFRSAGITALNLTHLFAAEKEQSLLRDQQIRQALAACHRRAILRSLARSIHIPHGWEDLALFH